MTKKAARSLLAEVGLPPREKAKHPVREAGGDSGHVRVFEKIAVGLPVRRGSASVQWLLAHDLIWDRGGRLFPYGVPIPVHEQWCRYCAEVAR
jgi:hypothetical protein